MSDVRPGSGRLQLLLIAAVFIGPLIAAIWLYAAGGSVQPDDRANVGALLEPIVNLENVLPASPLHVEQNGRWLLVFSEPGECGADCQSGLYTIRQLRLMLGRESPRVARIFLHGESPVDTVVSADLHEGLITFKDASLSTLLKNKKPDELAAGGYYLIDPQSNLVMYFHADLEPRVIVDDIKRLLKLSRIG